MNPKTIKIIYWVATILFSMAMMLSGITELMQNEQSKEVLLHLGYPIYLNLILGVAKVLGAIALLQMNFKTIKEWAYCGFAIDIIGASASIYFAGDGILKALFPAVFLAVMFVSYFFWKKIFIQSPTILE